MVMKVKTVLLSALYKNCTLTNKQEDIRSEKVAFPLHDVYNKEKENRYSILIKAAERTALPLRSAPRFGERGGSMVTYKYRLYPNEGEYKMYNSGQIYIKV